MPKPPLQEPKFTVVETLIIGTGFGGLCMGAKLREAGRFDFVILELVKVDPMKLDTYLKQTKLLS